MSTINAVVEAIAQVERSRRAIARLSATKPDGWKSDYAQMRPAIYEQLADAVAIAEQFFARTSNREGRDRFTQLVNDAKQTWTRHQARWPVQLIDGLNPEYQDSVRKIDKCFSELVSYVGSMSKRG